jgi:hypothetical protein
MTTRHTESRSAVGTSNEVADGTVAKLIENIKQVTRRSDETIRNKKTLIEIEKAIIEGWLKKLFKLGDVSERVDKASEISKILANTEDIKKRLFSKENALRI